MISGRLICRTLAALLGSLLLSKTLSAAPHNNKADIPALLQFAEQYHEQTNAPKQPSSPPVARTLAASPQPVAQKSQP